MPAHKFTFKTKLDHETLFLIRSFFNKSVSQMAGHLCTTPHIYDAMENGDRPVDQYTADAVFTMLFQRKDEFQRRLGHISDGPIANIRIREPKHKYTYCIVNAKSMGFIPLMRKPRDEEPMQLHFTLYQAREGIRLSPSNDFLEYRMFTTDKYRTDPE